MKLPLSCLLWARELACVGKTQCDLHTKPPSALSEATITCVTRPQLSGLGDQASSEQFPVRWGN